MNVDSIVTSQAQAHGMNRLALRCDLLHARVATRLASFKSFASRVWVNKVLRLLKLVTARAAFVCASVLSLQIDNRIHATAQRAHTSRRKDLEGEL